MKRAMFVTELRGGRMLSSRIIMGENEARKDKEEAAGVGEVKAGTKDGRITIKGYEGRRTKE